MPNPVQRVTPAAKSNRQRWPGRMDSHGGGERGAETNKKKKKIAALNIKPNCHRAIIDLCR